MVLNRRDLLRQAALSALALRVRARSWDQPARAPFRSARAINALQLEPFVDPLPLPQRSLMQGRRFRITMREIRIKMHRDLPPTRLWSYGPEAIGPLLEARSHEALVVEWCNQLPPGISFPSTTVSMAPAGSCRSRALSSICMAAVPPRSMTAIPSIGTQAGNRASATTPTGQDAAMLWYHDHAMGTSRLNLYAGLMGVYLLRDAQEKQPQPALRQL